MKMAGNTIVITGGAAGIGLALTEPLIKKGNKIKICDRDKKKLDEVKARYPEIDVFVCDLMDKAQRLEFSKWATSDGTPNMLINNAGIQRTYFFTKPHAGGYGAGDNEIEINLNAPIELCELFLPCLLEKPVAAILNIASSLATVPDIKMPVYCASKAGIHAFTRCLRQQLANTSVRIFEAQPPAVESGLNPEGRASSPPPSLMPADEYAAFVIDGLEADKFEINSKLVSELQSKTLEEMYEYFLVPTNPR